MMNRLQKKFAPLNSDDLPSKQLWRDSKASGCAKATTGNVPGSAMFFLEDFKWRTLVYHRLGYDIILWSYYDIYTYVYIMIFIHIRGDCSVLNHDRFFYKMSRHDLHDFLLPGAFVLHESATVAWLPSSIVGWDHREKLFFRARNVRTLYPAN
jgi:hypothetical protein